MRFELMIFFGNISSRVLFISFSFSLCLCFYHFIFTFMSLYLFMRPSKVEYYFAFWTLFSFCTCRSFVKTFLSTNLDTYLCSFAFWNRSLLESRLFHSNTITGFILFYFRHFFFFFSSLHGYQMEKRTEKSRHSQQNERKRKSTKRIPTEDDENAK